MAYISNKHLTNSVHDSNAHFAHKKDECIKLI